MRAACLSTRAGAWHLRKASSPFSGVRVLVMYHRPAMESGVGESRQLRHRWALCMPSPSSRRSSSRWSIVREHELASWRSRVQRDAPERSSQLCVQRTHRRQACPSWDICSRGRAKSSAHFSFPVPFHFIDDHTQPQAAVQSAANRQNGLRPCLQRARLRRPRRLLGASRPCGGPEAPCSLG